MEIHPTRYATHFRERAMFFRQRAREAKHLGQQARKREIDDSEFWIDFQLSKYLAEQLDKRAMVYENRAKELKEKVQ